MQELAESLRDRGHRVTVATSYPQHNLVDDSEKIGFPEVVSESGIEVLRIKALPPHMPNYIFRGIAQVLLPYIFLYKIKRRIRRKIDVVIVYSPPLPLAIVGEKIKKAHGARYILNVQDIFPQNAIDLGILTNRAFIKFFEHMEAKAYKNADHIAVHSKSNKMFLLENKGVDAEKLNVIHNWIDVSPYMYIQRTGKFRALFDLKDKFVILFAGVMGPSQGLEAIIKIAARMNDKADACFLFAGDGIEKARLQRMAEERKLSNVVFANFVSKDEYPLLVKDADAGLVCLSSKNRTPVVPGKILGYMAAGIPVIAFLNKESDGHGIIADAACGYSAVSDNEEKMLEVVLKLYNERQRRSEMGGNGFRFVNRNFEKGVCIDKLEKLF
jgi:glycosyltransferase involved in cell wall biosynthesis